MKEIKKRSSCPISSYLDIWGDKWSLLIIRDLMILKQCTYGDFLKSDEKIATNILASRLLMLEENDIIKKSAHPESKAKFLYTLTEKGIDILPIIVEITVLVTAIIIVLKKASNNSLLENNALYQ